MTCPTYDIMERGTKQWWLYVYTHIHTYTYVFIPNEFRPYLLYNMLWWFTIFQKIWSKVYSNNWVCKPSFKLFCCIQCLYCISVVFQVAILLCKSFSLLCSVIFVLRYKLTEVCALDWQIITTTLESRQIHSQIMVSTVIVCSGDVIVVIYSRPALSKLWPSHLLFTHSVFILHKYSVCRLLKLISCNLIAISSRPKDQMWIYFCAWSIILHDCLATSTSTLVSNCTTNRSSGVDMQRYLVWCYRVS